MMKHLVLLIIVISLFGLNTNAQHCEWDNYHTIIVDVRDSITGNVAKDLDIVLADSSGQPYPRVYTHTNIRYKDYVITQDSKFLQFGFNELKNKKLSKHYRVLPFAKSYYIIFLTNYDYPFKKNKNDLIVIKAKGNEKEQRIKFKQKNIVSLCTYNSIWKSESAVDSVKINVLLSR